MKEGAASSVDCVWVESQFAETSEADTRIASFGTADVKPENASR